MKKLFSLLLSFSLILTHLVAFATNDDFYTDFSGSVASKVPSGFSEWKSNGSLGNFPKLDVQTGAFGKDETDSSIRIYSPTNVSETKSPYIAKNDIGFASTEFSSGLKIASTDTESYKYAVLGVIDSTGNASEFPIVEMNPDGETGKLYVGDKLVNSDYQTNYWYGIDIEFGTDKIKLYVDGELDDEIDHIDIAEVSYIKCGLSNKTSKTVQADIYLDDVYLKNGTVDEKSLINFSSETVSIDTTTHTLTDIPDDTSVDDFVALFTSSNSSTFGVVNSDGSAYTSGNVKHGQYLKVTSSDGINRALYFLNIANCSLGGITNGETLHEGDVTLSVNCKNLSDITSILYYSNDGLIGTVTESPYELAYTFKTAGDYTLYAKIVTPEETFTTPKVSITFSPNKLPTVSFASLKDKDELEYTNEMYVYVNASDEDGSIVECNVYVDDTKRVGEYTGDGYKFLLNPISSGSHKIYATAIDNEGASTSTAELTITINHVSTYSIAQIDFNKGSASGIQQYSGSSAYEKVRDDFGLSYVLVSQAGKTSSLAFLTGDSYINSNTIVFECDYMVDTSSTTLNLILKADSDFNTASVSYTVGEWAHIKYVFNLKRATSTLYIDGKKSSETALKGSTFQDLRFNFTYPGDIDAKAYLDNYSVYCELEYPLVESVSLLSEDGTNATNSLGVALPSLRKIVLNFNTVLDTSTVTKDNFKLYVNDVYDSTYDVSYSNTTSTSVILTLHSTPKTNSSYNIVISTEVADTHSQKLEASFNKGFKTVLSSLDVSSWSVQNDNEEITNTNSIKKGDKITVLAKLTNDGTDIEPALLIFAIYNGNELITYKLHKIDYTAVSNGTVISDVFDITDVSNGITVEGYLWNLSTTASKAAYYKLSK